MTKQKRRWWLLAIPVAIVLIALVSVVVFQFRSGIRVTVENTGAAPLRSVVLHVTGASYNLGNIAPGDSATARVQPTSESQLEIEFVDAEGQPQRLDAGGYYESRYRGTIRETIKDGVINQNEQDIKLW